MLFTTVLHCVLWRTARAVHDPEAVKCLDQCDDDLQKCFDKCTENDDHCAAYIKWCKELCVYFCYECMAKCSPFGIHDPNVPDE